MKIKKEYLLTILLFLFYTVCSSVNIIVPTIEKVGVLAMPDTIAPCPDAPFKLLPFQKPIFPKLVTIITEKGAIESKPITIILNRTIDEVSSKGGGTVVVPAGKWKSGRIELKSNVNLHLAEGAEIEFSGDRRDYLPPVFTRHEGIEVMSTGAFIYANGQQNIAVTGKGTIMGPPLNAEMRRFSISDTVIESITNANTPVKGRIFDGMNGRRLFVPKSISPINCKNVLIEGITIRQSIFWNICPIYCENVIIRGVSVYSKGVPSGDGIDIESSKNVLIEYCLLDNGDDCFTLKAGRGEDGLRVGKPTENVVIRYCLAQSGDGAITCGSETAGMIRNIYAYDCVFKGTERGFRFKTRRNRGGGTEDIYYERIRMIDVKEAFTWDLLGSQKYVGDLAKRYPLRKIDNLTPIVRNIHVKNLIVESSTNFITANCLPEIPLNNVLIEEGEIVCKQIVNPLNDITGFTLRNLKIKTQSSAIKILNGQNVLFDNVSFSVGE